MVSEALVPEASLGSVGCDRLDFGRLGFPVKQEDKAGR